MPIFPWGKKPSDPNPDASKPSGEAAKPAPDAFSPEKARKSFSFAQQLHEQGNYEYALLNWLSGLRFDPTSLDGLQNFFKSAAAYTAAGNKGVSKQVAGVIKGSSDLDKYLMAILGWSAEPQSPDAAFRATSAAVALGLQESVLWIAPRALALIAGADKPRKDQLLKLMEIFHSAGRNDLAVQAGELALRLDPADNNLRADVRDLAAQASIDKGGYEQTGKEGGFRSNVKDLSQQRKLEESERVVKTDEVHARVIAHAKGEYLNKPQDRPIIKAYLKALADRGTPADEQEIIRVADKAFAETQEFQFRQVAGKFRLALGRRAVRELKAASEANPGDEALKAKYAEAQKRHLEAEVQEYRSLVEAYPTDIKLKFELGSKCLDAGLYEDAIEQFQYSRNDGQLKQRSIYSIGQAYQSLGWDSDAIETFRAGIANITDLFNDPMSRDFRYALMQSLQKHAVEARDLPAAEEAAKLAQAISMEQISYKDIRQRREQLKALIAELKAGG